MTSPKSRHQDDVTKIFHFQAPPQRPGCATALNFIASKLSQRRAPLSIFCGVMMHDHYSLQHIIPSQFINFSIYKFMKKMNFKSCKISFFLFILIIGCLDILRTRKVLQMRTSALFRAKTSDFPKFMVYPYGQRGLFYRDFVRASFNGRAPKLMKSRRVKIS